MPSPVRVSRRPIQPVWRSTAVAALGLAAGGTAGPLLAARLLDPGLVGLPVTLLVIGSALAAPAMGWLGRRRGRRRALSAGYISGALGAAVVVLAATWTSPAAFLLGSVLLGAGNTAIFMSRYAAAAAVPNAEQHPRAIAIVLSATAVGAVISPVLIGPLDHVMVPLGLPAYTGLYVVAFVAYAAAAAMQHGEHPLNRPQSDPHETSASRPPRARSDQRTALVQLGAVNLLMVAIMTVAPVHLAHHGAEATAIGLVVAAHVAAMFGPSPLSGRITTRIGPHRTFLLGMSLTATAGILAMLLDSDRATTATPALVVLGLGWNLGIVAASSLLVASRAGPTGESHGEISMGLAAGIGSATAGAAVAAAGMTWVWAAAAALSVIAGTALATRRRSRVGVL